ncbi:hypothetical protein PIB30_085730, partial [Stylosanthes scabra]|nr:hypothetical protein [Stylosanthes scabra]
MDVPNNDFKPQIFCRVVNVQLLDIKFGGPAGVAWEAGEPLVMEEVQVNPHHSIEIHIKVVSTSLCRSDRVAWESH